MKLSFQPYVRNLAGIPEFPEVDITVKASARSFVLRRRGGRYSLTVPQGADSRKIKGVLGKMLPEFEEKLRKRAVAEKYFIGQEIGFIGGKVKIVRTKPGKICIRQLGCEHFEIGVGIDGGTIPCGRTTEQVTEGLLRILEFAGKELLPAVGADVAGMLGVWPKQWKVNRALTRNGSCTGTGVITLSATLMLHSHDVVRYVICHELAHLTHFNHSAQFHALCNRYCLQCTGKTEKELIKMQKSANLPLVR